jgi:hypothetical protein
MGERGLAYARQIFDEQMAACQQTSQRHSDLGLLAHHYTADLRGYRLNAFEHECLLRIRASVI